MIQIELNYNSYFVGTFSLQCLLAAPSEQMFQKCEAAMKSYATIERNVEFWIKFMVNTAQPLLQECK